MSFRERPAGATWPGVFCLAEAYLPLEGRSKFARANFGWGRRSNCRVGKRKSDARQDAVDGFIDIGVPEPQHAISARFKPSISLKVSCLQRRLRVLAAVQLDDQIRLQASEVDNIGTKRVLTPKSISDVVSSPQQAPKFPLGVSLVAAKRTGKFVGHQTYFSVYPHPEDAFRILRPPLKGEVETPPHSKNPRPSRSSISTTQRSGSMRRSF